MMESRITKSTLVLLSFLLAISCKHDPIFVGDPNDLNTVEACDSNTAYFQNTILPILVSSCATTGCHDAATASDDIIITSYESLINSDDDMVVPGDPGESELYEVITETDPDKIMPEPPNPPLSASQINLIRTWIEQGGQNNYCESIDCDTTAVTFSQVVWPIINRSCKGCHSGAQPDGGILLTNYQDVAAIATYQLREVITDQAGFPDMPPGPLTLSDCEINQIELWILDGNPDN